MHALYVAFGHVKTRNEASDQAGCRLRLFFSFCMEAPPNIIYYLCSDDGADMLQTRPSTYHQFYQHFTFNSKCSTRKRTSFLKSNAIKSSQDLDFVTFTLIVDDLVFWDGTTKMGQLGGGGAQTAWGYQSVSPPATANDGTRQKRVGIAAGVGPDVPLSCLEWLEGIEVDISGIQQCEGVKTPRAWQILEQDGRRHEVRKTFFSFINL